MQNTQPIVLVTGATDGIGKQTAVELARRGFRVWVHGRNQQRCEAACDSISRSVRQADLEWVMGDFRSLGEVRDMAQTVLARSPRLDVLINNAGVYLPKRLLSKDGFETTLAINHLAHFVLTLLLMPRLRESAPARVITVSSGAHRGGQLDFKDLMFERRYDGYAAYARSKLCNILFSNELARRVDAAQVTSNSLHPGVITTKLLRAGFSMSGDTLEAGAETSVFLATDKGVAGTTGAYFDDSRRAPTSPTANDVGLAGYLWTTSEELTGLHLS